MARPRWNGRGTGARATSNPTGAALTLPFSSSFSGADEDPISEAGVWRHNQNNGWQAAKVRRVAGVARPDALSGSAGNTDDSYTLLNPAKFSGGIPANVEVIVTLDLGTGTTQEHEILLRAADSDTGVTCYECLYNAAGAAPQIMRWNGPLNSFTEITDGASVLNPGAGSSGNQLRATIIGSAIAFYWRANSGSGWTQIATATDTTYASGSVGIAFFASAAGGGSINACGFTDFSVSAL